MSLLNIAELNVSFGGLQAVKNLNLKLEKGKIYALIGPNGAGKTTVFNVITRLNKESSGSIEFNGKDITPYETHIVAQQGITRTFQSSRLFNKLSCLENVKIGCHRQTKAKFLPSILKLPNAIREEKEVTKRSMNALDFVNLAKQYNVEASNLPYGEKRKLEIARALAHNPELLLLDEPVAGMNENESQELRELISAIRDKGITVFLVEHDMSFVMNISDWIFVMNHGEKIAEGTCEDIKRNPDVIEAYLGRE